MNHLNHSALAAFPVVITLPVEWGEQDAIGHVNNIIPLRWFESARIRYFEQIGVDSSDRGNILGFILAATQCDYRLQITYPDTVHAGVRVTKVGHTSMTFEMVVVTEANGAPSVEASSVVVMFDYATQQKQAISTDLRNAVAQLEATVGNSVDGIQ